ncbi:MULTISPECIES: toll/interleukin-1 receptor domain-containing protein [Streptomyces]|uniref:toll/interleukin-1 receptor domain-containing protein n=1 Tax=Streptomyces TaxID=1883 RepID=UPI00163B9DC2|nr:MULTISPECIES: TIR domain-containing protein [Streptomyces]MBC2876711.1 toll/interleukin-1 receptor domain-containing protein [Streptomyces sp. TYQ1024]UBI36339.1 TIR domain-containing protein [Streptomyces mobaraensis]UKW28933.1 TIR domain-containing protein [Streptomyces sp. TYQ1024]
MHEVFINYRTGDGEKTAALLDQELSRRFGRDHIFRASKSIAPGETYPDKLRATLRRSSLLLAIVGPGWTNFRSQLHDPEDWVRKEIEEAFTCELPVVPILDGRKTDRLRKADLPPELDRLADLQSIPFDTHDTETGVRRIGDLVADMVPGLRDLSRADASSAVSDSVHNSIGDVSGTAVQSRDFTGDVGGTIVKGPHGPVHTGNGHIYQNSRHVSGDRHFSGDGMTYFEGDNHGNVQHRFGEPDRREDDSR